VAREERSSIHRVAFDPARGRLAGPPELVLGGSRVVGGLALSPDGEWLAWASSGLRENLFVLRLDGTGHRQVTDDEFRNRGPSWSADGSRITFYSNRSGRYEIWAIRPDGSGLERLTESQTGSRWFPEWSYDGTRLAISGIPTTRLLDPARPIAEREVLALPAFPDGSSFQAMSWSPDGSRLAGVAQRPDGSSAGLFLYHLASGAYERITASGRAPHLLADGRRLLYEDEGTLRLLDPASGRSEALMRLGPPSPNANPQRHFRISRDNRQLVFLRSEAEADVWLLSLD
jgi:WD40 repeat protein